MTPFARFDVLETVLSVTTSIDTPFARVLRRRHLDVGRIASACGLAGPGWVRLCRTLLRYAFGLANPGELSAMEMVAVADAITRLTEHYIHPRHAFGDAYRPSEEDREHLRRIRGAHPVERIVVEPAPEASASARA